MAIRCLIVDDEELAREALKLELAGIPDVEVVGESQNGFDAVKAIHDQKPDLVFLDIQMPRLDGFDVLELLGKEAPPVVFVTAFDEHALRAFEAQALDYLLKPVRRERLQQVLDKATRLLATEKGQTQQQALIDFHHGQQRPLKRVLVRTGTEVHLIPVEDIIRLEAEDDYVRIHVRGKSYLKTEQISNLEKNLDPATFCRIHRSHLINITFIRKIEPYSKESYRAVLATGDSLPISRSGYARLKVLL